jgi:GNAT superfamily N-acetyltransferase
MVHLGDASAERAPEAAPERSSMRWARSEDRDGICRVHVAALRTLAPVPYDEASVRAWAGSLEPSVYALDCAEVQVVSSAEEIVGFGWLEPGGVIGALYVHPGHWGRGHGRSLLARLEARAREEGAAEVRLRASLNAVSFYRSCGYVEAAAGWLEVAPDVRVAVKNMWKRMEDRYVFSQV